LAKSHIRTAREVLDDHLCQSQHGTLEEDLARNYSEEGVVLTGFGSCRGHEGMRYLTKFLKEKLPKVTFNYRTVLVEGELAFLEWAAQADGAKVGGGVDSYLVRDGHIMGQTIHYTVTSVAQAPQSKVG
jgi:hypothetical protein